MKYVYEPGKAWVTVDEDELPDIIDRASQPGESADSNSASDRDDEAGQGEVVGAEVDLEADETIIKAK